MAPEKKRKRNTNVPFLKRKLGLFNKLTELSIMCNAETVLIISSPNDKVYVCGNPSPDAVVRRFVTGSQLPQGGRMGPFHEKIKILRAEYEAIQDELKEKERKLAELEEKQKRSGSGGVLTSLWWDAPIEDMDLDDLVQFKKSAEMVKMNLLVRHVRNNNHNINAPPPRPVDNNTPLPSNDHPHMQLLSSVEVAPTQPEVPAVKNKFQTPVTNIDQVGSENNGYSRQHVVQGGLRRMSNNHNIAPPSQHTHLQQPLAVECDAPSLQPLSSVAMAPNPPLTNFVQAGLENNFHGYNKHQIVQGGMRRMSNNHRIAPPPQHSHLLQPIAVDNNAPSLWPLSSVVMAPNQPVTNFIVQAGSENNYHGYGWQQVVQSGMQRVSNNHNMAPPPQHPHLLQPLGVENIAPSMRPLVVQSGVRRVSNNHNMAPPPQQPHLLQPLVVENNAPSMILMVPSGYVYPFY